MKILYLVVLMLINAALCSAAGSAVTYKVDGNLYEGYFVNPGKNAPLVLLVHDWDGLTDYEVKRSEMLASMGYAVFAIDLFGKGIRPTEVKDKRQHTGELYKDREKLRRLLFGSLAEAGRLGGDTSNAVAMGYCFGGAAVLEFARAGADLKGFATFHGGLATPEGQNYSTASGNILIMHGTADTNITMEDFSNLAAEMEQAGIKHEMITYSGAPHAFTVFGSDRYQKAADEKSWRRFGVYLQEVLK
jgi:dienelactone hydrolase